MQGQNQGQRQGRGTHPKTKLPFRPLRILIWQGKEGVSSSGQASRQVLVWRAGRFTNRRNRSRFESDLLAFAPRTRPCFVVAGSMSISSASFGYEKEGKHSHMMRVVCLRLEGEIGKRPAVSSPYVCFISYGVGLHLSLAFLCFIK